MNRGLEEFAVVIGMVDVPKLIAKPIASPVCALPDRPFHILFHLVSYLVEIDIAMDDESLIGR